MFVWQHTPTHPPRLSYLQVPGRSYDYVQYPRLLRPYHRGHVCVDSALLRYFDHLYVVHDAPIWSAITSISGTISIAPKLQAPKQHRSRESHRRKAYRRRETMSTAVSHAFPEKTSLLHKSHKSYSIYHTSPDIPHYIILYNIPPSWCFSGSVCRQKSILLTSFVEVDIGADIDHIWRSISSPRQTFELLGRCATWMPVCIW